MAATYSSLVGLAVGGKYEIRRVLGAGGMGVVCEAIHLDLGKRVAVKLIDKSMKESELIVARFRREARAAGQIQSEHISKLVGDPPGSARITGSGAPIGTPLYMSPEQAEGRDDVDGRADIWSLGAVMYEALAGTPPFADRGSYHGTIVGILTSRPKLLHDAAPWVPPELARVIDAMLVHDRDARLPDAATVMQRLVDAFPEVLPDGTDKHMAVIVPVSSATVDTTGDTEIFRATTARLRRPRSPDGNGGRASGPPGSAQDSTTTMPERLDDAARTGLASPVDVPKMQSSSLGSSGGPKTAPLPPISAPPPSPSSSPSPWQSPSTTSSSGVSSVGGTAVLDPLPPPSELAPATVRDDQLAIRAERRRRLTLACIGLVIVGVAVGAFLAGSRMTALTTSPQPATSPTESASE